MNGKKGRFSARKLKVSLISLLLGTALLVTGCGTKNVSAPTADKDKQPIKIGAVIDISGPGASLGVPERDSIELWEEQVNKNGGINGRPVDVIILDNESDETKSVLAFKKLVNEENVVAVAGASQSGTSIAMINSATQAQIPLVSAAASKKIIDPIGERKWIFKTAQNDSVVADKAIEYLKAKKLTKIAFLSMNNAFGDSGLVEFAALAKNAGIEIVVQEKFGATDVDFTPQLTAVKSKKPQAMVVWAIPPSAALITKQARELGINTPILHSHGIANKAFIDLAGPAANGVVFPAGKLLVAEKLPDSDPQKAALLTYIKDYEKADRPRSAFGGHGYDAVTLIGKAIQAVGTDPAKIREALEKTDIAGVSGIFKMTQADHSGISKESLVMIVIKDGKWELTE
ncbi:MAG: ABC transporter substrate-binding protein [Solirubrobacterales bacterium]